MKPFCFAAPIETKIPDSTSQVFLVAGMKQQNSGVNRHKLVDLLHAEGIADAFQDLMALHLQTAIFLRFSDTASMRFVH